MVSLGEVAEINPHSDTPSPDGEVSFVGMADLDSLSARTSVGVTRAFSQVSKGYTVFCNGDILVAKITPCFENNKIGQAQLCHKIGVGSTEFHVLRPGDQLDDRYLLHFLRQDGVRRRGEMRMTGSAGQRRVPAAFLRDLQIPLPSLDEQRRLSAILEQAQRLTERYQTMTAHFDELIAAIFASIVEGPDIPRQSLRSLGVDFKSGKNIIGSAQDSHPINRVIKVSAVSSGVFDPVESKPLPQTYRPPDDHRIHKGDILFGRASGSIDLLGATAVVDQECADLFLPDKVWRLTIFPEQMTTREFILGVLRSSDFRAFVRHHASGAAGVRNIGKSTVLSYQAPVPCASAQQIYSDRVVAIRKQMQKTSRAATIAAELFKTLQSRAFSGQL